MLWFQAKAYFNLLALKNIIIFSEENDYTTSSVINWVNDFRNIVYRINTDDPLLEIKSIQARQIELKTSFSEITITVNDIVWFRRISLYQTFFFDKNEEEFQLAYKKFRTYENITVYHSLINWIVLNCKCVGNELRLREENLISQYNLNRAEVEIKHKNLARQEGLLKKGVVSLSEYEQNEIEILNAERNLKNLAASISQIRESMVAVDKNYNTTEISKTREEAKLLRITLQSFNFLKKSIVDWENRYVFKSEIEGKVSFLNYWSSNQTVTQNELIFTIIPNEKSEYLAKVKAKSNKAGVIEAGQRVNIRLNNYPEMDFGILQGKVSSISLMPDQDGLYMVNVKLPNRLISTYGKLIPFRHEMTGQADIILKDHRLLVRFFNHMESLIKR